MCRAPSVEATLCQVIRRSEYQHSRGRVEQSFDMQRGSFEDRGGKGQGVAADA